MTLYITTRTCYTNLGNAKLTHISADSVFSGDNLEKDFLQTIGGLGLPLLVTPEEILRTAKDKGTFCEPNVGIVNYKKEENKIVLQLDELKEAEGIIPRIMWCVTVCDNVVLAENTKAQVAADYDYTYLQEKVISRLEQIQAEENDYPTKKDVDFRSEKAEDLVSKITSDVYRDVYRYDCDEEWSMVEEFKLHADAIREFLEEKECHKEGLYVTLIRYRQDGLERDVRTNTFCFTGEERSEEEVLTKLKAAILSHLVSSAGEVDLAVAAGDYNWSDAIVDVPDTVLAEYGFFDIYSNPVEGFTATKGGFDIEVCMDEWPCDGLVVTAQLHITHKDDDKETVIPVSSIDIRKGIIEVDADIQLNEGDSVWVEFCQNGVLHPVRTAGRDSLWFSANID